MGRLLKHRAKDNKWRLWSANSDQWITGWLTEDEVKQELVAELEYDYKIKVIERLWTFPDGFHSTETLFENGRPYSERFSNVEAQRAFFAWQSEAFKGDYWEEVDKKFNELMGLHDD